MAPVSPLDLLFALSSRASLTKRDDGLAIEARNTQSSTNYTPGQGVVDPTTINNNAVFALFGILGAGCVLTGIWFFFWAKNGGCVFRRGDWDEYKSTVLRRKGPNGTTLSGATKTTDLGGGSIVGSQGSMSEFGDPEKGEGARKGKKTKRNGKDEDVRAYRSEKVARVGGLNREADGSYHDYSTTEGTSLVGSQPVYHNPGSHVDSSHRNTVRPVRTGHTPVRQYSFNAGTEVSFSVASEASSHRPLNPAPQYNNRHSQPSPVNNRRAPGTSQPSNYNNRRSERASMPGGFTEPLDFESRHNGSDLGERNTKAYFHPIPGLASNNGGASRGFRRGGGGRRDSLSDSEDTSRSYRS